MGQFKTIHEAVTKRFSVTPSEAYLNGKFKYYPKGDGSFELGSLAVFRGGGGFRRKGFEPSSRKKWFADVRHVPNAKLSTVEFNPITGENVVKIGLSPVKDSPDGVFHKGEAVGGNPKGRQRARVKIFDYIRSNSDLNCMFTLTFDGEKIARTDYDKIVKEVGQWLSNRVRRKGLKYLCVPEYHADGEAVHLHGVCNFDALSTEWSGKVKDGKRVYNITDFPYGFTAVKRIGKGDSDRHAVAVYVSKYITKSSEKVGGRYFLHGGKMDKPKEIICEVDEDMISALLEAYPCKEYTCNTPIGSEFSLYTVQADKRYLGRKNDFTEG